MLNLDINEKTLNRSVLRAREQNVIIPSFQQLRNPGSIPDDVNSKLNETKLWDVDPINLFRVTWKNEPREKGGLFGKANYLEIPESLSGVEARIVVMTGKWFPTGSHKVGATFGCIVPGLVTGQFDPTIQKAVWPSTGNFCRGGAYISSLLGCESIAILPEEMTDERFAWLDAIAGEVIKTPGGESNIKEIYDKCKELEQTRDEVCIFNQFENFGNYLWHYAVTGPAFEEILNDLMKEKDSLAGLVTMSGSAGTAASGDYLKQKFPLSKIAVGEPVQCPTMMLNGFGEHLIEGIGDKHIPWIHNVRNTDMVIGIDDNACTNLIRLFNEPAGKEFLIKEGIPEQTVNQLDLAGLSGIGNILSAIKFCKYYELTKHDFVVTVLTDSMELYKSRLEEYNNLYGAYTRETAIADYNRYLLGAATDNMAELTYYDKKRVHNLKYFTWVEQQGKNAEELNDQWYDHNGYWGAIQGQIEDIDNLIREFNEKTGLAVE